MSSSSSSWAQRIRNLDERIFRPRDWSNTVLFDTGWLGWSPTSLSFCRLPLLSNEGICFGQEFKGSPCFWPKKWKNVRAGARWRCYSRGKIAPDFFQGWFCATNALRLSDQLDTPPATPFSTFFNLARPSPLNLRIYNTTSLVDILSIRWERRERKQAENFVTTDAVLYCSSQKDLYACASISTAKGSSV